MSLSLPLMASPSSSTSRNYKFNVFSSFHGPDARKTILSHLRKQFDQNGITMFNDQEIVRSEEITPSLKKAIKESRISIVILSKNYASSGWCLEELVDILECKRAMGQIVMTIFYGVDPSDVRKQTGDFGIAFRKTCQHKKDEVKKKWSKALYDVGNIAGEDFLRWDNEDKMIEKIARDVSDKLNATPSKDFDGMVGLETHLREMRYLLDLDNDGAIMVGICGPSGIGKTTIARALQSLLSDRFQLTCFVDKLRGSYHSGLDDYGLQLHLQEQLLSKILNQDGMKISHLGVLQQRLSDLRVLIILDDVNDVKQLEALAKKTTWFGPGSRIVVTTENKDLLQQHGINNTYHVKFPSTEEALEILCIYAFEQNSPIPGFKELAERITELCGKLPLGLRVIGSSLRGKKNKDEWEDIMSRLKNILHRDIENVLRVGYESLDEDEQTLFLHIAVFFNYNDGDLVKTMFADSDLDVKHGLKVLENRSLVDIEIFENGEIIMMHRLLQQLGKKAIHKQEPWKRQILINAPEICDILKHAKGTSNVLGIAFDISRVREVSINKNAFKRMPNLRFLKVYNGKDDGNDKMHVPEEIEFPCHLRLLNWVAYPSRCLPSKFHPEYLVDFKMPNSKLEKLWEGIQPLKNLKMMDLNGSLYLKELPDLSNATNLEDLYLSDCESLVEIPSSCLHLHKLQKLWMQNCKNLEVIPAHMNLASLEIVDMQRCSRLRNIPLLSTNIEYLYVSGTMAEDVPPSIRLCSRLKTLILTCTGKLEGLTHLPMSLTELDLSYCDIERIPDCIKDLHRLTKLDISGCNRLVSLPELPTSLSTLQASDCESLQTIICPFNTSEADLMSIYHPRICIKFTNCFKLGQQARASVIQHSFRHGWALVPGSNIPTEFDQRAKGNSLTICHLSNPNKKNNRWGDQSNSFVVCVVILPTKKFTEEDFENGFSELLCHQLAQDDFHQGEQPIYLSDFSYFRTEHLFIFHSSSLYIDPSKDSIVFEFSTGSDHFNIIECGAKVFEEGSIEGIYDCRADLLFGDYYNDEIYEFKPSEASEDKVSQNNEVNDDWSDEFKPSEASQHIDCDTVQDCEDVSSWDYELYLI